MLQIKRQRIARKTKRLQRLLEVVAPHPHADTPPGDMELLGQPSAKLKAALELIEKELHPLLDVALQYPGKSKESCILCSETTRAFLFRIGFRNARTVPVFFYLDATRGDTPVRSVGIGDPRGHRRGIDPGDRWNGHAVVLADGFLIDTTLYGAQRPEYQLAGMMAVELFPADRPPLHISGHRILTGMEAQTGDLQLKLMWADQPTNLEYLSAPDYKRRHVRDRVAGQLVALYRRQYL